MRNMVWDPTCHDGIAVTEAVIKKVRTMNLQDTDVEAFLDSDGHICIRTVKPLTREEIEDIAEAATGDKDKAAVLACLGTDVIVMRREDAKAIDRQLGKYRESCGGDEGMAYGGDADMVTHLWDNLNGTIYPCYGKRKD